MGKADFSDDFKRDAVAQITERVFRLRRFRSGWASVRYSANICGVHQATLGGSLLDAIKDNSLPLSTTVAISKNGLAARNGQQNSFFCGARSRQRAGRTFRSYR